MKSLLVWRPVYKGTDCLCLFIGISFLGARREKGANVLPGELPPTLAGFLALVRLASRLQAERNRRDLSEPNCWTKSEL